MRKPNFLTGPVLQPLEIMAHLLVKGRLIPTETGVITVGATAQMRKIFKSICLALLLALISSTHVQAELSAWRLWFLQEDEVIEADGYFLVKKTKAVRQHA